MTPVVMLFAAGVAVLIGAIALSLLFPRTAIGNTANRVVWIALWLLIFGVAAVVFTARQG